MITPPDVRSVQLLPPQLTAKQVGAMFSLTARSVTGMALRGEIPAHRVGGVWRFDPGELRKWYAAAANR